jgi:hypothetical protein
MERPLPMPAMLPTVTPLPSEAYSSGVSWGAVVAGGTVTAALALVLLALGAGFGLSAISPWAENSASMTTLGASAIAWIIAMEIVASAIGGYLAGRLRTKWTRIHSDEVYFRDTAHGFLSWALASVASAAFLASAATLMVGSVRSGVSRDQPQDAYASNYYVDALFRPARFSSGADIVTDATRAEAGRILAVAVRHGEIESSDRAYLVRLVASKTGLAEADAERQVDSVLTRARTDLDSLRTAAARLSLWIFLALLIGAFCSSYAATIGGRQRDRVVTVS